jgi:hypothetical protein
MCVRGFTMDKVALEAERAKWTREAWVREAQKAELQAFPQGATDTQLVTSNNIALHYVTDFMVLFPKFPQQRTCYENPMLDGLQLTTMSRNYPEKGIRTIGNIFFKQQLDAGDFSTFGLEMTDELEDSLTKPRANSVRRFNPTTDVTSFVWCVPVERDSGAGLYFDGLDSNGKNVSVALRGNSIFQGSTNTYFQPVANANFTPPPPILVMIQDSHWVFSARNGGECKYETNKDYNETLKAFNA